MGTGHLIFGKLTDHITGETLPDTPDERIRQNIARILTDEKGFSKNEIRPRQSLPVEVDGNRGASTADFVVAANNKPGMVIIFGPGSVVTRQRPALAVARLLADPVIITVAVITNGAEAVVMDARSGKTLGEGLAAILSRDRLLSMITSSPDATLTRHQREKEKRILFAMDILTRRECESYTCATGL